ncbi:granulin b isoform X1 [Girardinichthys multiradiatus]|uniref:granulin b isoform X1 n=1 Tax=Girardinichthys multiradiatus TaxID=208333 RepID=UPI001FAE41D3|nr:granulin b isoform X1 [Girardinichthys multiradiatus]
MTLQMGVLFLAVLGLSTALICPDGGMCEDRNTCCKNTHGGYGCCPLPHAECCSDHLHCCYEGTVCDLIHQKCVNKTVSLPWMRRLPTKQRSSTSQLVGQPKAVMCPDHESECPDDTTCCQLYNSSWACCPLPKAVCCEDKRHCCPEGSKCDLVHLQCVSSSLESLPMLEKLPAKTSQNKPVSDAVAVICSGGKSSCPDAFTCCLLTSGEYGCCPHPEATCCNDHLHCCPSNTTCDLEHGVCKSGEADLPLTKKIPAVSRNVECPDKKSFCPDLTTCCQMTNGSFGCCPMPNAVCCSDHIHCCPSGTKCDIPHSACVSVQENAPVSIRILRTAAEQAPTQSTVHAVPCNASVACDVGNTCCKSLKGEWACCPLPQAVCCKDHLHCCPNGTVCNLAASMCDHPSGPALMPLLPITPAFHLPAENSKCDESTSCPGEATCCKTASGEWACCPLLEAVCCDDHIHCCPHGMVCNLEAETCDDSSGVLLPLPLLTKVPALTSRAQQEKVMCDTQTSCPKDTTCCFMGRTHKWGCCPLPEAVCCKDGNHCCPSGHTCDPHRSSCSRGPHRIPWFTKLGALTEPSTLTDVKCDDKSSCASGMTCCKLSSGEWGCCPLVKAVCCTDHEHCCPQGYTCNMQTATCEKKGYDLQLAVPLLSKVEQSELREAEEDTDVPCDSTGLFHCPKKFTCCKISATEWSCCPSAMAKCCADTKHCCPIGYSCDLKAGGCTRQSRLTRDYLLGSRHGEVTRHGL